MRATWRDIVDSRGKKQNPKFNPLNLPYLQPVKKTSVFSNPNGHILPKSSQIDGSEKAKTEKLVEEGTEEAFKEQVKEHQKASQMLDKRINTDLEPLLTISSVFPFDFFQTDISVDLDRISFKVRNFFASQTLSSVLIKDVADIHIDTGPFLAKLTVVNREYSDHTTIVKNLWKKDAEKVLKLTQGLIVADRQKINLSTLESSEITKKIQELGQVDHKSGQKG